jgi:hypothetical protein
MRQRQTGTPCVGERRSWSYLGTYRAHRRCRKSDTDDPLLLDVEHGLRKAKLHAISQANWADTLTCCVAAAVSFLSFRFLRLSRRFADSTFFSYFFGSLALAFVSRSAVPHALSPREMLSP